MSDAVTTTAARIQYPESDGKPMAETETHVTEMMCLVDTLRDRYRLDANVYVAGNNFIYYEEGVPESCFSPDVYVVFGVPKSVRRTYLMWNEKEPPTVVFEFTSRKTRMEDKGNKKAVCADLGVAEYFLCDPEQDYLRPPLQGFRLEGNEYRRIVAAEDASIVSEKLGVKMKLEGERLLLWDAASGERVLRPEEAREKLRKEQKMRRKDAAEIERLRAELARLKSGKS
jgi:Uma2 family endonuclease